MEAVEEMQPPRPRRKCRPRRNPNDSMRKIINAAEARREITRALQLHKASSPSTRVTPRTTTTSSVDPSALSVIEYFEWGDEMASLQSWWVEFLKSLDGKKGSGTGVHQQHGELPGMVGDGCSKMEEVAPWCCSEVHDRTLMSALDEWLTVPETEIWDGEEEMQKV